MISSSLMDEGVLFLRARVLTAIESEGSLALLGPDGDIRKLEGSSADLASAVLSFCAREPRTRAAILAHVEELTGEPLEDATIVDELLDLLRRCGALVPARAARVELPRPAASTRLLLCIGGAVASAHTPALILRLQAEGFDVRVAATEAALRFVARETLEALTHRAVFSSMWQRDEGVRVPHIELAAWPDAVLVCPATASLLSRIATGDCSELVSAIAITTRAPVLVAPSMNDAMYDASSVQRNLETLKADGFHLVPPTFASEVAHAPTDRTPMLGGAPSPMHLARLVHALLRVHAIPGLPRDRAAWDALHERVPEPSQAWFTPELDPKIASAIESCCTPPGLLWDVGTGHGACAIWAARKGFSVVATDVSKTALDRARRRAGALPITFLADDVTDSALCTPFDVIVDRGTLHALPLARRDGYARTISSCTRPGSIVIVEAHAPPEDPRVLSNPMTEDEITALMGPAMQLVRSEHGTFAGTLEPAPASVLCVFRRLDL